MSMENTLRRHFSRARTVAGLLALAGLATVAGALEDAKPAAPQGLAGIMPTEIPASLSEEAFGVLGKNWAEWSAGASSAVGELYKDDLGDVATQRQAIATAKSKLKVLEKARQDRKYAMILNPLTSLSSALTRRIDVAEAILATLELDGRPDYDRKLKSRTDAVLLSIESLKRSLQNTPGGNAWLPYIQAEELAAALKYEAGGEAATSAAKTSKDKLASRSTITDPRQKSFLSRSYFLNLESAIDQYLAVAEYPPTEETAKKMREQLAVLVAGLDAYEETGSSTGAADVRRAYSAIRKMAPDEGNRITQVLQKHYFNYNVRVVTTEDFLSRLMSDTHAEQGQVSDFILGANVSGFQTTSTNVNIDLRPSQNDAKWVLNLTGNINSNTQGVTTQATVNTQGNHSFHAVKEVRFNGTDFTTGPGTISVNANNTTTGIRTAFTGRLFGRIADNIAAREVEARRGQAQAIAASRVEQRVLPRFNQEVDAAFVKAEQDLKRDFYDRLRATGLHPDAMLFQTTDSEFRANTRLMASDELAANAPPSGFAYAQGATLYIHESELNNGADRIGLAGKTMNDDELRTHLEQYFSKALNRPFKIERPAQPVPSEDKAEGEEEDEGNPPSTFVFAETDPIRIRLQNGELTVVFRSGFQRDGGDPIPQQIISVPLTFEVRGSQIFIKRGAVSVAAAEGGGAGQIATAGIIRRKIQNTLPERTVNNQFTLRGTRHNVIASIRSIKIVDGWAIVNAQ